MVSSCWSVDVFVHKQCNFKVGRRGNKRRTSAQSPRICINQPVRNTCLSSWRNCLEPDIIYAQDKYILPPLEAYENLLVQQLQVKGVNQWSTESTHTIAFSVKADWKQKPSRNKAAQVSLPQSKLNTEMPTPTLCFSKIEETLLSSLLPQLMPSLKSCE